MKSVMDLETTLSGEHFIAEITFEFFDTAVRLAVSGQGALDGKRPEAVNTFVRLLMRVYTYVTD